MISIQLEFNSVGAPIPPKFLDIKEEEYRLIEVCFLWLCLLIYIGD